MEFGKINIDADEALYMCGLGTDAETFMQSFADLRTQRHINIDIRHEADGGVSSACLRTVWRYLLFQGKTGGKKINLYAEKAGSPGNLIHKYSKVILRNPMLLSDVPLSL
jgi:hypothetical protein